MAYMIVITSNDLIINVAHDVAVSWNCSGSCIGLADGYRAFVIHTHEKTMLSDFG